MRTDFDESAVRELCSGVNSIQTPFSDSKGDKVPVMQHNVSGILHARSALNRLACGRLVSRGFSVVDNLKFKWPVCGRCRLKFPIRVSLPAVSKARPSEPQLPEHNSS